MKRHFNRKFFFFGLSVLFSLLIIIFLLLPLLLREVLEHKIEKACDKCEVDLGLSRFNIFTGSFGMSDLHFKYTKKGLTEIDWKAETIRGEVEVLKALSGDLHFGKIEIKGTRVEFYDGDAPKPPPEPESEEKSDSKFTLAGLELKEASFLYIRKYKDTLAKLNIVNIEGHLEELGNTPELIEKDAHAVVKGRIEESGQVALNIFSPIFQRPVRVSVDVDARGQNLSDLNTFFKENDGISLFGQLLEGTGQVRLLGNKVNTAVYCRFRNFDVKFSETTERGPTMAFFTSLGAAIIFEEKNTEKDPRKRLRRVEGTREKDESLVSFILRSLKEAAISVAQAK